MPRSEIRFVLLGVLAVAAAAPAQEWTTDSAKMKFPDAPVAGKLQAMDFKLEAAEYSTFTNALTLQTGKGFIGDARVVVFLFMKQGEELSNKTFEAKADEKPKLGALNPHVHIGGTKAKPAVFTGGFAMRLQFGAVKDGQVTGKIYLCLPDESKSVLAGTFTAKVK